MKPEETIHYEYEQVIEQPEPTTTDDEKKDGKSIRSNDIDSIKIENTKKKTIKTETKKIYEKTSKPRPDQIKTITRDVTTYIKQEQEEKQTEDIEKQIDSEKLKYQQLNNKVKKHSTSELDTTELDDIMEQLEENIVSSEGII
jgi:hypothetical protein